jgi:hypothetical protein
MNDDGRLQSHPDLVGAYGTGTSRSVDQGPLPDSGERTSYGDGKAVREADPDKPAVEGIPPTALLRLGTLFTNGGIKYRDTPEGFRNWENGMPWMRCYGAIVRHAIAWLMRDKGEDHLAAIAWNAAALIHYESYEKYQEDDDRPDWGPRAGVRALGSTIAATQVRGENCPHCGASTQGTPEDGA